MLQLGRFLFLLFNEVERSAFPTNWVEEYFARMQLFQRARLATPRGGAEGSSSENNSPEKDRIEESALELWRGRSWLWAGYGLAAVLLLAWGWVILPGNGLLSWVWWLVAPVALGAGGWWHWRQVQWAKRVIENNPQGAESWNLSSMEGNRGLFLLRGWRKWPVGLGLVLVAGLGLTILVTVIYPHELRYDAYQYSLIGYDYAHNGYKPDAVRSPGYTLLVAGVFKLAGGAVPEIAELFGPPSAPTSLNVKAMWGLQVLLLSLTALVVYGLVGELRRKRPAASDQRPTGARWWKRIYWGEPVGLLAAGLVASCPFLIAYTSVTLTEIAATFWLTVTSYFWVKALKYRGLVIYPIFTGVALAWLMETRPTFVYLPVLTALTLVVFGRRWGRLWQPGLMAVGLGLFLWPQLVANLNTFDEPGPVLAADLSTYQLVVGIYYETWGGLPRYQKVTSAVSYDPTYEPIWERLQNYLPTQMGMVDGKEVSKADRKRLAGIESDYFKQYFADYVKGHPLEYAGTVGKRLWWMWDQHFVFPYYDPGYFDYRWFTDNLNRLYLIAGLVGMLAAIWRWGRLAWPLWLGLGYLTAVNALVRIEFRYTLPGYPVLLGFAALGLWEIGKVVLGRKRDRAGWVTLAGAGVALGLVVGLSVALPLIPPTNAAREKALDVMAQANDLSEVRQFWAAEPLYNQAIAMYPTEPQVWSGRGNYFAGIRRADQALPDFSKAIALDPQGFEAYRWRGQALVELKRNAEAAADYRKFLQLAPANHPSRGKVERELKGLGSVAGLPGV